MEIPMTSFSSYHEQNCIAFVQKYFKSHFFNCFIAQNFISWAEYISKILECRHFVYFATKLVTSLWKIQYEVVQNLSTYMKRTGILCRVFSSNYINDSLNRTQHKSCGKSLNIYMSLTPFIVYHLDSTDIFLSLVHARETLKY